MKASSICLFLFCYAGVASANADEAAPPSPLGAFVGDWDMRLYADPETFGERGGEGSGHMQCRWGELKAWVDCELDSNYAALGRYVMKMVLYPAGASNFGAFVTNSFGGGRLYDGQWTSPATLEYRDAWIDPDRAWPHQRVVYIFHDDDALSFAIEVSRDGIDFKPHSSGRYRRR